MKPRLDDRKTRREGFLESQRSRHPYARQTSCSKPAVVFHGRWFNANPRSGLDLEGFVNYPYASATGTEGEEFTM